MVHEGPRDAHRADGHLVTGDLSDRLGVVGQGHPGPRPLAPAGQSAPGAVLGLGLPSLLRPKPLVELGAVERGDLTRCGVGERHRANLRREQAVHRAVVYGQPAAVLAVGEPAGASQIRT